MTPLRSAIAEFERMVANLREIASRQDEDRRADLVRLRRGLASHIQVIREAGAAAFGTAFDDPLAREFRSRLSTVQSAIATHQANWPAVSIDRSNADFLKSSAHVAQTNRAFIEWVRGQTGPG